MKRRWKKYQVDNPKKGYNKTLDQLTETEAKDELCDAMDLICKLTTRARDMMEDVRKQNYAV